MESLSFPDGIKIKKKKKTAKRGREKNKAKQQQQKKKPVECHCSFCYSISQFKTSEYLSEQCVLSRDLG